MKYLTVEVTQADIDGAIANGSFDNGADCPVARAVRRSGYPDAYILCNSWRPRKRSRLMRFLHIPSVSNNAYETGRETARWIADFGLHRPVSPTTLTLELEERP